MTIIRIKPLGPDRYAVCVLHDGRRHRVRGQFASIAAAVELAGRYVGFLERERELDRMELENRIGS